MKSVDMDLEFETFKNSEEISPPKALTDNILLRVHKDLNPSGFSVFKKLAVIQFITGFITLLFCPQFGVGFFNSLGLMGLLMRFGDTICMAGCGAVFLGLSAFAAAIILRPEEIRVIRHNQFIQFPLLALLAIGIFICVGAPILATLGVSWFLGSVVGAISTLRLGLFFRSFNH